MKTKTTLVLLLLTVSILSFGQDTITAKELRKIVLKSDVVLASRSYSVTNNYANDYSVEQFYTINRMDTLIKNTTQFKMTDKIRIQQQVDDYSAFWSEYVMSAYSSNMRGEEYGARYTNLLFLKKEDKQYKLLGIVESIKWDEFMSRYNPVINQLMQIGKINNLNERYTIMMDWFIENNSYPDWGFIAFYTQKGIIQEEPILTEEQQQKATENFLKGSNELRPFINEKTVKSHALKKLKEIRNSPSPDYWDFYIELSNLYKFEYASVDYILQGQLNADCLETYDKRHIMDYFIEKLEEEIESEK